MTIYNNDNLADGLFRWKLKYCMMCHIIVRNLLVLQISYVMGKVSPCENCFDINYLTAFL